LALALAVVLAPTAVALPVALVPTVAALLGTAVAAVAAVADAGAVVAETVAVAAVVGAVVAAVVGAGVVADDELPPRLHALSRSATKSISVTGIARVRVSDMGDFLLWASHDRPFSSPILALFVPKRGSNQRTPGMSHRPYIASEPPSRIAASPRATLRPLIAK
jgi:hypothetical protein